MTARELGKLGAIRGSKVGGNVTKTLMELGKQKLQDQRMQTFDQEVAKGEAEFDELDPPSKTEAPKPPQRPEPMF